MSRALGCEQGVQVNLVGFRALVTAGVPSPEVLLYRRRSTAVPRAGGWTRGDAAAWWDRFRQGQATVAGQALGRQLET